jgi:hypothetical protein
MTIHPTARHGDVNEGLESGVENPKAIDNAGSQLFMSAAHVNHLAAETADRVAQQLSILFSQLGLPGISEDRPKRETLHGFVNQTE